MHLCVFRSIVLCVVRDGAIFGDVELVQDLPTFSHTVVTTTYTEVFTLSTKNIERLVHRRNMETLDILEDMVAKKIMKRATYLHGANIPLVNHLLFKMTDEQEPIERPPYSLPIVAKSLPDRLTLFQNIAEEYLHDKAQLLESCVPGGVYFKAVMRQRSELRARQRQQKTESMKHRLEQQVRSNLPLRRMDTTRKEEEDAVDDEEMALEKNRTVDTNRSEKTKPKKTLKPVKIRTSKTNKTKTDDDVTAANSKDVTFMTEVDDKLASEVKQTPIKMARERSFYVEAPRAEKRDVTPRDCRPEVMRHQSFLTVCLVYDEKESKSRVVHHGSMTSLVADDVIQPQPPKTPSDAQMVGAPAHMDSRGNSRHSSRSQRAPVIEVTRAPAASTQSRDVDGLPPLNESQMTSSLGYVTAEKLLPPITGFIADTTADEIQLPEIEARRKSPKKSRKQTKGSEKDPKQQVVSGSTTKHDVSTLRIDERIALPQIDVRLTIPFVPFKRENFYGLSAYWIIV